MNKTSGGIFMKLTYEDKVEMYRLWKEDHYSSIRLATLFKCDRTSVTYIVKLIDIHGISVVQKKKNREYCMRVSN